MAGGGGESAAKAERHMVDISKGIGTANIGVVDISKAENLLPVFSLLISLMMRNVLSFGKPSLDFGMLGRFFSQQRWINGASILDLCDLRIEIKGG